MWLEIYLIGLGVTLIVNLCYERWTSVVRDCSPQKTSHESWTTYSLSVAGRRYVYEREPLNVS